MAETNVRNAGKQIMESEKERALKALEELKKEKEKSEKESNMKGGIRTEGSDKESEEEESSEESGDISKGFSEEFESEFLDSTASERHAPVLKQEELEERVSSAPERNEGRGGIGTEGSDDEIKYSFEMPKYSFSHSEDDDAELKRAVLRETPSLIERAQEAREVRNFGLRDSMLEHNETESEEQEIKYVRESGEHILEKSDEARDKAVDVRKYSKNR